MVCLMLCIVDGWFAIKRIFYVKLGAQLPPLINEAGSIMSYRNYYYYYFIAADWRLVAV